MTQITVDLPDSLAKLPAAEQQLLIRAGLHEAVRVRLREIKSEIDAAIVFLNELWIMGIRAELGGLKFEVI